MKDLLSTITGNKLACTGSRFYEGPPPNLIPQVSTEDEFVSLVSEYYKFFREDVTVDVAFLLSVERSRLVAAFDRSVNQLRTAKQHNGASAALKFYKEWIREHQSWQGASDALAALLIQALTELARISSDVRRDQELASAWKERASVEPETIFDAVCDDLRAQYYGAKRQSLIANVKRRVKRLNSGARVRECVEDFCAQEITAETRSLPVPYYQVLDRLGLLGKPQARAALLVAYAISDSTALQGDSFLVRVEETWKLANS